MMKKSMTSILSASLLCLTGCQTTKPGAPSPLTAREMYHQNVAYVTKNMETRMEFQNYKPTVLAELDVPSSYYAGAMYPSGKEPVVLKEGGYEIATQNKTQEEGKKYEKVDLYDAHNLDGAIQ
jgi:hypothetical protein